MRHSFKVLWYTGDLSILEIYLIVFSVEEVQTLEKSFFNACQKEIIKESPAIAFEALKLQ